MQGLSIRMAKALNRLWQRSGKIFADRFHSRALKTPREVRNALAYVLLNTNHHGVRYTDGCDPCSSGASFDGWRDAKNTGAESRPDFLARARTWCCASAGDATA